MSHRPARLVAAIATVVGLLLLSAGLSSAQEPPPPKNTFTVGSGPGCRLLEPLHRDHHRRLRDLPDGLSPLTLYGAKDFSIQPGLAESWEESPDKTFWTYKIRPGLKWSDGAPLTAKDAAYTFNRIINGTFEKPTTATMSEHHHGRGTR